MSADEPGPVQVLLVDDHELLVQTLVIALQLGGLHAVPARLGSAREVVCSAELARPALVLLDLDLGEPVGDGAELVPDLVATGARVLVLTGTGDPDRTAYALERGAAGAVRKDIELDALLRIVRVAVRGDPVMAPGERRELVCAARSRRRAAEDLRAPFHRLSTRESQVLHALARGRTVARIAEDWCVAEATVRSQVRGVLTKLDVGTQLEAVALAHRSDWLRSR